MKPLLIVNGVTATCSNCKHWDRVRDAHLAPPKRHCRMLACESQMIEDVGTGTDFQPFTAPDFFCAEWKR